MEKAGKEEIGKGDGQALMNSGEERKNLADHLKHYFGCFTIVIIPVAIVFREAQVSQGMKQNRAR